jgi:ATPase subunit of ABC transporter with duplicated ATPase domains
VSHVELAGVGYFLPDGRNLLYDVSFRVGDGAVVALLGANGAGKSTLLQVVAGDLEPHEGTVVRSGRLGVMRQFIGSVRDATTVRELLGGLSEPGLAAAVQALGSAQRAVEAGGGEAASVGYAQAIADFGDHGGWDAEVLWETCCREALGLSLAEAGDRRVGTLSGGEQKRLALEALLRGDADLLLLDEPDNYLDVPGKRWLEERLRETPKTVLLVTHDRELIANAAQRIVTVEARSAWTHGGGFATYAAAREARIARLDELRRRWDEERAKLVALVRRMQEAAKRNADMASAYKAAQTRLRRFEEAGPPPLPPRPQDVRMRLRGGRTGRRAVRCEALELTGLTRPFSVEVHYGEQVAVLGANGSGKSHFLRLLAGEDVAHGGTAALGARVVPGHFVQTHEHPELAGRTPLEVLMDADGERTKAMGSLTRYGLQHAAGQRFETLSGGQQARLQVLLLETSGATLLLLDEPTDNLDLESAEALEHALDAFAGTVLAVTHDRWFARRFDRFLVFRADERVVESAEPVWDA